VCCKCRLSLLPTLSLCLLIKLWQFWLVDVDMFGPALHHRLQLLSRAVCRSNRSQLNTAKTEFPWSTTSRRLHQLPQLLLRVGSDHIAPASVVRDLGIYIDSDVSMRSHVAKTVLTCHAVLRQRSTADGPSVGQCLDPFSSRWCRLSSSRGWTTAMRHWSAFHHISCRGCSQ